MADYLEVAGGSSRPGTALRRLWKFPRSWLEVRSLGWKSTLAFVPFYLVRDTHGQIIVPCVTYEGLLSR